MKLEIPDEYGIAFIGFLELGLTFLEMREAELQERDQELKLASDEIAVIEAAKQFIAEHEEYF